MVLTGLEKEIDRILSSRPKVFLAGRYDPEVESNRVVLAELFTGADCGPCVAADLAFDGLMERYNVNDHEEARLSELSPAE